MHYYKIGLGMSRTSGTISVLDAEVPQFHYDNM